MLTPQQLFIQYQPIAKQLALGFMRRLPRSVLADDVVAAAMVGLWEAVTRGREHESFEWYARTCVRGAILDELRRQDWLPRRARARNPELSVCSLDAFEYTDAISALSVEPDAEQGIESKEREAVLRQRLASLPKRDAELLAYVIEGRPHWQIAEAMGISEPRVSQLRTRAELRITGQLPVPASPVAVRGELPPCSCWEALVDGTWQYCETVAPDGSFGIRLRPAREPRPLPLRDAAVLRHWLSCGRPLETAKHFAISRSHVLGIIDTSLKSMGFDGNPSQVPVVLAIAACDVEGGALKVVAHEDGFASACIARRDAWLTRLSASQKDTILGLLVGETRNAMAARRGSTYRTIAEQLRGAFLKLRVSTVGELRAHCAREHVQRTKAQTRAA
jgi:RNA polymerase sigma factor (sigma-70 family)